MGLGVGFMEEGLGCVVMGRDYSAAVSIFILF